MGLQALWRKVIGRKDEAVSSHPVEAFQEVSAPVEKTLEERVLARYAEKFNTAAIYPYGVQMSRVLNAEAESMVRGYDYDRNLILDVLKDETFRDFVTKNTDFRSVQEALCFAIQAVDTELVAAFLETDIDVEAPADLPMFSATFVAMTGFIPHDFSHRPRESWQSKHPTTQEGADIFADVLDALKDKYEGDRVGYIEAVGRQYELEDPYRYEYGKNYVSALDAARPGIQDFIKKDDPELWANKDRLYIHMHELRYGSQSSDATLAI